VRDCLATGESAIAFRYPTRQTGYSMFSIWKTKITPDPFGCMNNKNAVQTGLNGITRQAGNILFRRL